MDSWATSRHHFCSRTRSRPTIAAARGLLVRPSGGLCSATAMATEPLRFLVLLVASWLRRQQGEALEYLRAENRVLRTRLGPKRLRFTDSERRLLAAKGEPLVRRGLPEV